MSDNTNPVALSGYKLLPERFILFLSISFFIASLLHPAFYTQSGYWLGIFCLLFGWLGISEYLCAFSWIANPLLFAAYIAFIKRNFKSAFFISLLAATVCVTFLFGKTIIRIIGCGIGFCFWAVSIAVMALGSGLLWLVNRRSDSDTELTWHANIL